MDQDLSRDTWLVGLSEERLAGYQSNQGRTNNCGEYAAAAALSLLFARKVSGLEMAALANRGWLLKGLRTWPGGPTSPAQQARLVREYARLNGLSVHAARRRAALATLRQWLQDPDIACLVTIAWDNRRPPVFIFNRGQTVRAAKSPYFWSGHTMVLAAYRPAIDNTDLQQDYWGFINSWSDPSAAAGLYWLADEEFKRCFEYPLFPIGSRNVVVIRRIPSSPEDRSETRA